ncbi:MAG: SGNH/GDSL hydrolase family protein, partial [Armatimonadia bacterium]
MNNLLCLLAAAVVISLAAPARAATIRVDVNSMPRIVFTGDSQTCGRVGALDYPQMLSWEVPLRVFNTGVGGTSITHLIREKTGGTATLKAGEKVAHGEKVGWGSGPYPGQKIRFGKQDYVVDRIEMLDYKAALYNVYLTEPAREDFTGTDFSVEEGWRVRIAEIKPQYAVFMYSVNDPSWTSEQFKGYLAEITRRCRESNITPIFLSGFPLMEAPSGGSHPGTNDNVLRRPQDMLEFCQAEKLAFGDVFRTLMLLDEQRTSVWVDTVHPTTDGSLPAIQAMRYLLKQLGAVSGPFVRGYRVPGSELPCTFDNLSPITPSQPDYNARNEPRDNEFDLESIRIRDEYGLLATADGQCLKSEQPLVLEFGQLPAGMVDQAAVELVSPEQVLVSYFDPEKKQWVKLCEGSGKLRGEVPAKLAQTGLLRVAVQGKPVLLDYAGLELKGDFPPSPPAAATPQPLIWPEPGQYAWPASANLIANGDLTRASSGTPDCWVRRGNAAYQPAGTIAKGTGDFREERLDQFQAAGQAFNSSVRPLDMVVIEKGPEGVTGNFLIQSIIDDETLDFRRFAKTPT